MTETRKQGCLPPEQVAFLDDDAGRRAFVLGWNACRSFMRDSLPDASLLPKDWQSHVTAAMTTLRQHNQTVPDEAISQMRVLLLHAPVDKSEVEEVLPMFEHDNPVIRRFMNSVALLAQAPCADSGMYFAACLEALEEHLTAITVGADELTKLREENEALRQQLDKKDAEQDEAHGWEESPVPHSLSSSRSLWAIRQSDLLHLMSVKIGAAYTSVRDASARTKIQVYPAGTLLGQNGLASLEVCGWRWECYAHDEHLTGFTLGDEPPAKVGFSGPVELTPLYAYVGGLPSTIPVRRRLAESAATVLSMEGFTEGARELRALLGKGVCA